MEWAYMLHGRSGVGMESVAPLSFQTVESWSRQMGIPVDPEEIEALMLLDAAILNPEEPAQMVEEPRARVWKDRPPGVEPVFIRDKD